MATFRFPGMSFQNRLTCHFQGLTSLAYDVWAFSRNGTSFGQVYFKRDRDVKLARFKNRHIGGIDSAEGLVVIPQYEPEDGTKGKLAIMDCNTDEGLQYDPNQVYQHDLDYRPYAAAICKWGKRFLIAVVAHSDGNEVAFYRWTPESFHHLYTQYYLGHALDSVPRNNMVLRCLGDDVYLYLIRAHLMSETVIRYTLRISDTNRFSFADKHDYRKKRRGICSSRFASTIVREDGQEIWIRTQRNAFFGRLRYRKDTIRWEE